jgi:high-affinity iron transporter
VTAAFFLMLREGLEAALIVGIIAAYLVKVGRRDALGKVWLGVGVAVALSVASGILVVTTVGRLPLVVQETIEGVAALAAVAVLTWMLFWMRRQGRALKGELERGVDAALAVGSTTALAGLAFFAVAREGLETVLFLFAVWSSSGDVTGLLVAALAGLAVAVGIGYAIFAMGVRIDLRKFFTITGVVLIFVSAGLVSFAIAEFTEAGLLPVTPVVFDLGTVLPETSPLGSLLAGLFGYRSAPTMLEVVGYLAYLVPVLTIFVFGGRAPKAAAAAASVALALVLAGCSTGGGSTSSPAAPSGSAAAGGTTVEVAASEYKFDPNAITVPAGSVSFHVTNTGTEEHEFEIFKGETVVDEIEGLVPGLDRTLTVTLEAGDYTFACKLNGHDQAGMTGTLTVSAS